MPLSRMNFWLFRKEAIDAPYSATLDLSPAP
jgi:hypothetical protein